ncbi:hypothetical protein ACLOJK_026580 [Asimina triloba]
MICLGSLKLRTHRHRHPYPTPHPPHAPRVCSIYRSYRRHLPNLIVGFDVEWRPSFQRGVQNRIAILQLCVGQRCLIFQLAHADAIPRELRDFLADPRFTFVGVRVEQYSRKLLEHHGLRVGSVQDLRSMAVDYFEDKAVKRFGLKDLAYLVLNVNVEKPRRIATGAWDAAVLTCAQVKYAFLDAYLSFQMAVKMISDERF